MGKTGQAFRPALQRVIALPVLVLASMTVVVPAAMAQDRPVGVAQEKTAKNIS